jgi:hypothetical protein
VKKHSLILDTFLLVLFLGLATPQFAQDPSTNAEKSDEEAHHRALLMGLVRTINTEEIGELSKYGSYSSWETLLVHRPEHFNRWLTTYYPEGVGLRFGDTPEILPGFSLRFNVCADGQGYDMRLQDTTDKKWGYAAFSDESGAIWQGEPLH